MVERIDKNLLNKLEDGRYSRKFIISPVNSTLYLCMKPLSQTKEVTHQDMAINLNLKTNEVRGGVLLIDLDGAISYVKGSRTIPSASNEDLSNFVGEIVLFDA